MAPSKPHDFHSFCKKYSRSFGENMEKFLIECADHQDYQVDGNPVWRSCLLPENGKTFLPLFTVEETVDESSREPFCDHCRSTGWGHHYVSKKKYHMIIPLGSEWDKSLSTDVFKRTTQILHGIIHCNGYGHLLCIDWNGGGSGQLDGEVIMSLWDRICENLHARIITVRNGLKWGSIDLQLIHSIAYKKPWFSRWDYKFYRGSFAVEEHDYTKAMEELNSLDLDEVVTDIPTANQSHVWNIINHYKSSGPNLILTLGDLLGCMLSAKAKVTSSKDLEDVLITWDPELARKAKEIARVVISTIKGQGGVMKRADVREVATRIDDGTPGKVVDVILRLLDNVFYEDSKIFREKKKGYWTYKVLEDASTPGDDLYRDMYTLYKQVLLKLPKSQTIVHSNCFSKNIRFCNLQDLNFICKVLDSPQMNSKSSPGVVVVVAQPATVDDIKKGAEQALNSTYWIMDQFLVGEIKDVNHPIDVCRGSEQLVMGYGIDLKTRLRFEGGTEVGKVKCVCGANDFDGEEMVLCKLCLEVVEHARCRGHEEDIRGAPRSFVCSDCYGNRIIYSVSTTPTSSND